MEQVKITEPGNQVVAAPVSNKETKRSASKDASKGNHIIREFLQSIGQYEADALRICVAIADGKSTIESLAADERLALNRYLNNGVNKEQHSTPAQLQELRMTRAFKLMERASGFCDKAQVLTVNQSLVSLAVNANDINEVLRNWNKVPEAGKPNTPVTNGGK